MGKRIGASLAVLVFVFCAAQITSASSDLSTSTVATLQSLVAKLQAELTALQARQPIASSVPMTTATPFGRTLSIGSKGADVSALQQTLKAAGFYTYPTITGYFGAITEKALAEYQKAHGLNPVGYVGPKTRSLLNSSLSPTNTATAAPTTPPGSNTSNPTAAPSALPSLAFGGGGEGGGGGTQVVAVTPATTAPSVSLTTPISGATVSGSSVSLTATASDSDGTVANVQFKVDGTNIGSAATGTPYTTTWNSKSVADGSHTVAAVAEDTSGNYATSSITVTVRNSPPVISAISSGTPTTTAATVTWTTDESASSTVNFGTTTAYGTASTSAALVTSHSITLTGLSPATTYHFQVASQDAQGNVATSSDQTFTTAVSSNPPVISSIATSSVSSASATVTWTTDTSSNSEVVYGLTTSYGSASSSVSLVTSHSITLIGLSDTTTYHYAVVSADAQGHTSTSSDETFTTPAPSWVLSGAAVDMDFVGGRYYGGALSDLLSLSRVSATTETCTWADGHLTSAGSSSYCVTDLGIAIWPSGNNLLLQSNFAATWTATRSTLSANAAQSPDVTTDAATLIEDSTPGATHFTKQSVTKAASAIAYTGCVYAAQDGRTRVALELQDGSSNGAIVGFDLANGNIAYPIAGEGTAFTSLSASMIESYDSTAGQFWRICILATSNTATTIQMNIYLDSGSGVSAQSTSYNGSGTSGIYLYGAQLNAATSLILPLKTTTTTSSISGADDTLFNGLASSTLLSRTFTIRLEANDAWSSGGVNRLISGNSDTSIMQISGTNLNAFQTFLNSTTLTATPGFGGPNPIKPGFGWSVASLAVDGVGRSFVVNGGTVATDSGKLPSASNTAYRFAESGTGGASMAPGYYRRITIWPTRVSDTQLESQSAAFQPFASGKSYIGGMTSSSTDIIQLQANQLQYEYTQAWTAMAQLRLDANGSGGSIIFTNVSDPSGPQDFPGYECWISGGKLDVRVLHSYQHNQYIDVSGSTNIADGKIHNVACTYDGSGTAAGVNLYVDGKPETLTINLDTLGGGSIVKSGQTFAIANQTNTPSHPFLGSINWFSLSNVVRPTAYIEAWGASLNAIPPVDSSHSLYFDFREGSGLTTTDRSNSGFNGTLSPTTLWQTSQVVNGDTP